MAEKPQIFTPAGGANQDDSLITPSKGTDGRSLFRLGDYRYARNGRIGSSREGNFDDFETIRSTLEVTDYYTNSQILDNSEFTGTLSPWLVSGDGDGSWVFASVPPDIFTSGGDFAVFSTAAGVPFIGKIIYQTGLTFGETVRVSIAKPYLYLVPLSSGTFNIVFLNGSTVVDEVEYEQSLFIDADFDQVITVPSGVDGIGFRVVGTAAASILDFAIQFNFFRAFQFGVGSPPAGDERVVGRLEDKEFLKVFYAVHNSNEDHTIRMYDYAEQRIYELLRWSGLNYSANSYIKMAKLDNWLAMANRDNPPRLFDVDTIADLFQTLGENEFREFHISFHKWAPTAPAICKYYYDGSINNWDTLKGKSIQFSYRYIYKGRLRSRWSPISKSVVTSDEGDFYSTTQALLTSIQVDIPGFILDEPGASVEWNYFNHQDPKFYNAVERIEIAFRYGERDLWKLWKRVEVVPNLNPTHYFNGDFDGRVIDDVDFTQPFDTVPFRAGTVEAIDNRFIFGDCINEYEQDKNFSVSDVAVVTADSTGWISSFAVTGSDFTSIAAGTKRDNLKRLNAASNQQFKPFSVHKLALIYSDHRGFKSLGFSPDNWLYTIPDDGIIGRRNALTFKIPDNVTPPEWATSYQIVRQNSRNIDYFILGQANRFTLLYDTVNAALDASSLPQNIKDRLAQHFENSGIVDGYTIAQEISAAEEGTSSLLSTKDKIRARLLNPVKSTTALNQFRKISQTNFLRFNSLRFKIGPEVRNSAVTATIANASRIYIDINNWYNAPMNGDTANRALNKLYYNFREGDRVRFWGSETANPTTVGQLKQYDVEILEFTGSALIVEKPEGIASVPNSPTGIYFTYGHPIEVYTPTEPGNVDNLFYEVGEWYPILYPGTEQRDFSKRDWTYTSNAAITLSEYGGTDFEIYHNYPFILGDSSYVLKRVIFDNDSVSRYALVSMNPDKDKTYDFWERHTGRPTVPYLEFPQARFIATQARFGGKIVEESFINNLNRFRDEDQFIYPSEYGRIRDLVNTANAQVESVGAILLAIGEREAWSIYINRTTIEDISGKTIVAVSDKVLGSYNALLGSHGTLNPESVSKERGNVYWWNAIDGAWVRYGRNGLTPFSDYKMRSWFKTIASLLFSHYNTENQPWVISEFDPYHEEVATFIEHSSLPATFRDYESYKGWNFSEADTRWKHAHDYTPELFSKMGTELLSFKDGKLYRHEQGTDYLNFYGQKYDAMIEPVFNEDAMNVKSWQSIAIIATHGWSVERILSEYRGAKTKQQSRIPLTSFENKEDTMYAAIKNNLNTPNVTNPIVNGDKMRSKAIQVLMKLDPTVEELSLLHWVTVTSIDSPKNPVNL